MGSASGTSIYRFSCHGQDVVKGSFVIVVGVRAVGIRKSNRQGADQNQNKEFELATVHYELLFVILKTMSCRN